MHKVGSETCATRRRTWMENQSRLLYFNYEGKWKVLDMGPEDIIKRIKAQAEAVRSLGATALYIYGSRARGDDRPDSDLDVFVDFDPGRFSFVELVALEEMLARELGLKVQLATHDALHPLVKSAIEQEAIRVL
jgi:uncharacterized protein